MDDGATLLETNDENNEIASANELSSKRKRGRPRKPKDAKKEFPLRKKVKTAEKNETSPAVAETTSRRPTRIASLNAIAKVNAVLENYRFELPRKKERRVSDMLIDKDEVFHLDEDMTSIKPFDNKKEKPIKKRKLSKTTKPSTDKPINKQVNKKQASKKTIETNEVFLESKPPEMAENDFVEIKAAELPMDLTPPTSDCSQDDCDTEFQSSLHKDQHIQTETFHKCVQTSVEKNAGEICKSVNCKLCKKEPLEVFNYYSPPLQTKPTFPLYLKGNVLVTTKLHKIGVPIVKKHCVVKKDTVAPSVCYTPNVASIVNQCRMNTFMKQSKICSNLINFTQSLNKNEELGSKSKISSINVAKTKTSNNNKQVKPKLVKNEVDFKLSAKKTTEHLQESSSSKKKSKSLEQNAKALDLKKEKPVSIKDIVKSQRKSVQPTLVKIKNTEALKSNAVLDLPKVSDVATLLDNVSQEVGDEEESSASLKKPTKSEKAQNKTTSSKAAKKTAKICNGWRFEGDSVEETIVVQGEAVTRRYYTALQRKKESIYVHDAVLLQSGAHRYDLDYIARVSAIWEDSAGVFKNDMMISVFWYYKPEQVSARCAAEVNIDQMEVFASRHQDDNSVACIVDKCYVTTFPQFNRYRAQQKLWKAEGKHKKCLVAGGDNRNNKNESRLIPSPGTDPSVVFFCRHAYDYRLGRIMKGS